MRYRMGLIVGLLFSSLAVANPNPVRTAPVQLGEFVDQYEAIGTTRAKESIHLTSKVSGIVNAVHFRDGEFVERGELLLELDGREERSALDIAELEAADQLRELKQLEALQTSGATHQADIDRRRTQYQVSAQRVKQLATRVEDYSVRAPFAGLLGLGNVSEGALITPGDSIVTLDSVQTMELDFSVPATWLSSLRTGQKLSVSADAFQGREFDAEIIAIDSRVDPISRSIKLRAGIDNSSGSLLPGLLVRVVLKSVARTALIVPETALVPRQDRQYVYLIDDDQTVLEREVGIGSRHPGEVEIVSGLDHGTEVIVEGLQSIRPGQEVRVLENRP